MRKNRVIGSVNNRVYLVAALATFFVAAACGQGPQADFPSQEPSQTEDAREASPAEGSLTTISPSPQEQAQEVPAVNGTALPNWRYVNSGWVEPVDGGSAAAFTQELRAFVITNQQELDAFNAGFTPRLTRGTSVSLARIDFEDSILLAAYYLWRPVQGDPLLMAGFSVDITDEGNLATVELELDDQPQGRLRPYLMAPLRVVVVGKDMFPAGETMEFVFKLDGEPVATVTAVID